MEEVEEAEEAPQPYQVDLHLAPESLVVEDHQEAVEDHQEAVEDHQEVEDRPEEYHQSLQQEQQQQHLDKVTN